MEEARNQQLATEAKNQGNKALQENNAEKALECFTKALTYTPSDAILYSNRSAAYAIQNKWQEALDDAEKAVQLNPDWFKAYSRKGLALIMLGKYEAAVSCYESGLQKNPDNPSLKEGLDMAQKKLMASEFNVKAEEWLNKGNAQLAYDFLKKSLSLDSQSALFHSNFSVAACALGIMKEAHEAADEVIRSKPQWHRGYQRKAEACYRERKYEEAASWYSRALSLNPGDDGLSKAFHNARQEAYLETFRKQNENNTTNTTNTNTANNDNGGVKKDNESSGDKKNVKEKKKLKNRNTNSPASTNRPKKKKYNTKMIMQEKEKKEKKAAAPKEEINN